MHTATLLQGACDTHVHFAPDIVPRLLSGPQLAAEARELGMRAILLKNHYCPTYLTASAIDEMFPGLRVFGGLVLNAACGGLNPDAVRCALRMGAKEIWMPTVSSLRHVTFFHAPPETLCVPVFDDRGRPAPGLPEILDLIAHSGAILGTGHLSPFECEALVSLAKQAGVRKILVTHPEFEAVDMDRHAGASCRAGSLLRTLLSRPVHTPAPSPGPRGETDPLCRHREHDPRV